MSNERRHELENNELAVFLGRINKAIEPYSRFIAIVVGGVAIVALGMLLFRSQQSGQRSDATLQLIQGVGSQDPEVLLKVGTDYPDTSAGTWARLYEGQQLLSDGIASLYTNRASAIDLLGQAQVALEAAKGMSSDTVLRSRAQLGIARAQESLGSLDDAVASYQGVVDINESPAMVTLAQNRISAIKDPTTREFMDWFADQDFSPADPSMPPTLLDDKMLSETPDLQFPDVLRGNQSELSSGGLEMPEAGAAEADATEGGAAEADATEGDASATTETSDAEPATTGASEDAGGEQSTSPDAADASPATAETDAAGSDAATDE